jgi:hypothetical protein
MRVAALFVQENGCYFHHPDVDPWPEARDARTYAGNDPVVAHPPCANWGRYAHRCGGVGNDSGCFASALATVRRVGGVIEHPANSRAWKAHGLWKPGWIVDEFGGWSMYVEQRWFGHEACKPTWLYIVGCTQAPPLPAEIPWSEIIGPRRPLERLSKAQRAATPPPVSGLVDQAGEIMQEGRA